MAAKPLSKTKIVSHIAEKLGTSKKTVATFFEELHKLAVKEAKGAAGKFVIPPVNLQFQSAGLVPASDVEISVPTVAYVNPTFGEPGRYAAEFWSGDRLLAQVRLVIGEQQITAIITADAAKEMRLKPGERAAALIKSTEVMILRV